MTIGAMPVLLIIYIVGIAMAALIAGYDAAKAGGIEIRIDGHVLAVYLLWPLTLFVMFWLFIGALMARLSHD